jgi:Glycosyl transferase family 90
LYQQTNNQPTNMSSSSTTLIGCSIVWNTIKRSLLLAVGLAVIGSNLLLSNRTTFGTTLSTMLPKDAAAAANDPYSDQQRQMNDNNNDNNHNSTLWQEQVAQLVQENEHLKRQVQELQQQQQQQPITTTTKDDSSASTTLQPTSEMNHYTDIISTNFSTPMFNKHVDELLFRLDKTKGKYDPHGKCMASVRFLVDQPYTPPSVIECKESLYCWFFQLLFALRPHLVLPYNVSLGFAIRDNIRYHHYGQCIGSSAPDGFFSMNNFHDIKAHSAALIANNQTLHQENANKQQWQPPQPPLLITGYQHNHSSLPWESRHKVPIFRGHPRYVIKAEWIKNPSEGCVNVTAHRDLGHRTRLAVWSVDHPEFLDAMVDNLKHPCDIYAATNGLDHLFFGRRQVSSNYSNSSRRRKQQPSYYIPPSEYYTNYQTVVVMGGIGAAFRTARHLSAGQAVVLHDHQFLEWYYRFMTPYQHYIPLDRDLSNLANVTAFVRDHPEQVQTIARAGQQFYQDYLSFPKMEEHWYEFLYKFSIARHEFEQGSDIWKEDAEEIWRGKDHQRFRRNPQTGLFLMQ